MAKFYAARAAGQPLSREHTRPFYVVDHLDDLQGPSEGEVVLPVTIDWTPAGTFDVRQPARVRSLYAKVLHEAGRETEISQYVNRDLLAREWRGLRLAPFIREAWEATHPELRR